MDWLAGIQKLISQHAWLLSAMRIVFILIISILALWIVRSLVNRFKNLLIKRARKEIEGEKRAATLGQVISGISMVIITAVALMMILAELGIDLKPIIAAAGIGGLAIGFGAQNLIRDLISGFFMLAENQVRVGDVVMIGDAGGVVENITLRVLSLRDLNGNLHIIPHGNIERVKNMSHTFSYCLIDMGVSYRENVDEVIALIKELGDELMKDPGFSDHILEPLDIWGLDRFEDSALVIRARFKTAPGKQWAVLREMNRRMKNRFDEMGIEIPFPHQTVYFGVPKKGQNVLSIQMGAQEEGQNA
jgi:small-conductance mechanosensitive channel